MNHEGKLVAEKEIEVNNYDIDAMGIVVILFMSDGLKTYEQYLLINI